MYKGKEVVEFPSLSPHEALYDVIQYVSDAYIDDQHLVASDPYHLPYWIDSPLTYFSVKRVHHGDHDSG